MFDEIVWQIGFKSGISFSKQNTVERAATSKNELQVILLFREARDSL